MIDITPIIEAVIGLIAAIVGGVLIPYIRSKTTAEDRKEMQAWVLIAVKAVEQLYAGKLFGDDKKNKVIEWLENHNITVDASALDAMIEAAVYEINKGPNLSNEETPKTE